MRRAGQLPTECTNQAQASSKCQKCLESGHWTFECKKESVYKSRPTRSALLLQKENQQKKYVVQELSTELNRQDEVEKERKKILNEVLIKNESKSKTNNTEYSSGYSSNTSSEVEDEGENE